MFECRSDLKPGDVVVFDDLILLDLIYDGFAVPSSLGRFKYVKSEYKKGYELCELKTMPNGNTVKLYRDTIRKEKV